VSIRADDYSINGFGEILHERGSSGRKAKGRLISKGHSNEEDHHQEAFSFERKYC